MARQSQHYVDELIARYTAAAGRTLVHSPIQEQKEIDNPEFLALDRADKALHRRKATAGDPDAIPEKIPVTIQQWRGPDQVIQAYQIPGTGDWDVIAEKNEVPAATSRAVLTPQQTAMSEEEAEQIRHERSWNLNNGPNKEVPDPHNPGQMTRGWGSGRSESHEERAKREAAERTESRAEGAVIRAENAEDRAIAAQKAQADQQAAANALAQAKFDYDKEKDVRPQMASTPTDTTKNIAIWDPASQSVRSVENPMYDAAKAQAAQLKDQLSTAIALNQITAQQAAQQYKQWWDTNVELPFKQAQEQRARAAEQRAALEAEDRRKQFASDFSLRSGDLGFRAGNAAVQNEISLLPYRAGPEAGEQFSSAFNSLARGGKIAGPDASAGINFTADAFEFDRPDFEGIASKATANALKGLTKYKPSGTYSQADYSGISTPSGAGAPSGGNMIDTSTLWQQFMQNGVPAYAGPQEEE